MCPLLERAVVRHEAAGSSEACKESVLEPAFRYASDPSIDNLLSLLDGN